MNVLVDSDILIEVIRARNAPMLEQWQLLVESESTIAYSPISLAELRRGARPDEHARLDSMFDALVCIPADAAIGRLAGDLLHLYSKSHSLDVADAIIAAPRDNDCRAYQKIAAAEASIVSQ